MKKNLIIRQDGNKECGSACLLSIIRYFGGNISINRLIEATHTSKLGTSFYNLQEAASAVGLSSKSYKVDDVNLLSRVSAPFICQINMNNYYHFVVVYNFKKKVTIMDPARGKVVLTKEEFVSHWTGNIILFEKNKPLPYFNDTNYLTKLVIEVIRANYKLIINIFVLSLMFALLSYIFSFHFKIIIDDVINTNLTNLKVMTIIFLAIVVSKTIVNYIRNNLLIYLNQKLDLTMFVSAISKVLLLPYNYYKNRTTGEVISRINDLSTVKTMVSQIIITVFLDLLIAIVGGVILFSINAYMFMISLIIIIMYTVIFLLSKRFTKRNIQMVQETTSLVNSNLVEVISGFETIKGLHLENDMSAKIEGKYLDVLRSHYCYEKTDNVLMFLRDMVTSIGLVIIIYIGTKDVMKGVISIGSLVSFNTLLTYFLSPMQNVLELSKDYYYSLNALKRANNLFDIDEEHFTKLSSISSINKIVFNNVTFSFNGRVNILNNMTLEVNACDKVLLLGPSGTGKSTILKLIYKYYEISRNAITIDGRDICDYSLEEIRSNITYVSQEETLCTDTIKNNILLNRHIDDKDYQRVLAITHVNDIINDLFLGDKTKLEEGGLNLSGGQRQRIVLARALLKPSSVIMIDEGLNEVDINLERQILKGIFAYFRDKIIIVVSHRLDNMELYDKVVKIKDGQVDEILERND